MTTVSVPFYFTNKIQLFTQKYETTFRHFRRHQSTCGVRQFQEEAGQEEQVSGVINFSVCVTLPQRIAFSWIVFCCQRFPSPCGSFLRCNRPYLLDVLRFFAAVLAWRVCFCGSVRLSKKQRESLVQGSLKIILICVIFPV